MNVKVCPSNFDGVADFQIRTAIGSSTGNQLPVDGGFETDIRDLMCHRSGLKRLEIGKKEDGKSVFGKSYHVMAKTHKGSGMSHGS
tara:strand:+ start:286 stop:543 length:258 start_codon:yes stop_codon:yes gene_type:complete